MRRKLKREILRVMMNRKVIMGMILLRNNKMMKMEGSKKILGIRSLKNQ